LSTAVLSATLLGASADRDAQQRLLPAIARGAMTVSIAVVEQDGQWAPESVETAAGGCPSRITGTKELVLDGAHADWLLVLARAQRD
jgi:alkylation response protein AidB-like acyl-CoA dehydrogenase